MINIRSSISTNTGRKTYFKKLEPAFSNRCVYAAARPPLTKEARMGELAKIIFGLIRAVSRITVHRKLPHFPMPGTINRKETTLGSELLGLICIDSLSPLKLESRH